MKNTASLAAPSLTTPPNRRQPIPFGKYLLLDRVNIGGMAEVWRAKTFGSGGFERLVAIKRILPNIAEDEEFITMFIDEAKITVQLNHANIAQIYELSHIAKSYFIAMEYVSGKDTRAVFDRCRKRGEPAPVPLSTYVLAQCCEGMDYAHRAKDKHGRDMNIVHRDVSPQNVLISYDGEVKVIDFGIAKAAGKASKTQAGILKGKFGYMSPEQIRGLPLDRRSDVFALGVCLYEMLTGERLFVGDSDFSVLEKVRKVDVVPPSHFNRKIPDQLEKIVMKALAKDVDERYQYGSELAEDLRAFMYSTGNTFTRKDLASFMKATFAEDFEKERSRLQEYADIKPPDGMFLPTETAFVVPSAPAAPPISVSSSAVTRVPDGAPLAPPVPSRPPTGPRLTAPPVMGQQKESQATIVVGGPNGFDDATNADSSTSLVGVNSASATQSDGGTDPNQTGLAPSAPAVWNESTVQSRGKNSQTEPSPVVKVRASKINMPAVRASAPPRPPTDPSFRTIAHTTGRAPAHHVAQDNTRLIIALAAVVAVLLVAVIAAIGLQPAPTGLVVISVPQELKGKVELQINGQMITEKDGRPLAVWPVVQSVKVGKAMIRLSSPGYETLIESVEIKENDPVQIAKELKKEAR